MFHRVSDGHGPFRLYIEMEIMGGNFGLGQEIPCECKLFDWLFWRGYTRKKITKSISDYQMLEPVLICLCLDIAATIGASN